MNTYMNTSKLNIQVVRGMVKSEVESVRKSEVPVLADLGVGDNWRTPNKGRMVKSSELPAVHPRTRH